MSANQTSGDGLANLLHSLAEVLVTIRTPLVLVAFFVAAIVVITWLFSKERGRERARITIVALSIAGLLVAVATVSYLYEIYLGSDLAVFGVVQTADGRPIPGAVVTISGGLPAQATNNSGQFTFSIPRSIRSDSFNVRVQAEEYEPYDQKVLRDRLTDVAVVLKSLPGDLFTLQLGAQVLVSHFLGEPVIGFGTSFSNKSKRVLTLRNLSLDVSSSDNSETLMLGALSSGETAPVYPPMDPLQIPVGGADVYLWWARVPWGSLGINMSAQIKALPEYSAPSKWPCFGDPTLTQNAVDVIRQSFKSTFMWAPGSWKFGLHGVVDGIEFNKSWTANLTAGEIERMKAVLDQYKDCVATSTGNFLVSNGPAVTFVHKPIRESN